MGIHETGNTALGLLGTLTKALARAEDSVRVYEAALSIVQGALGVDRASILTFDEAGVARFRASTGLSDEYRRADGHCPWTRGEANAQPVLVRDVQADRSLAAYRDAFAREDIRALAFIPLSGSEGCLGKLMLYYREIHDFRPEELELAAAIGTQVAFALERVCTAQTRRLQSDRLAQQAALLELAHDSIFVAGMDGTIAYWNAGARQLYGWTAQEAVGQVAHDLLRTVFPEPLPQIYAALHARKMWQGELVHTTRSGEQRIVSSRWALREHEHGGPPDILEINRDITEQKRQEMALRKSEELLSLAARSTGMGTFDFYPADGTLVWSRETRQHFGLPEGVEPNYETFLRILHPADRDRMDRVVRDILDRTSGPDFSSEYRTVGMRDGQERWIAARGYAFFDQQARAVRIIGITLDITERKRQEQRVIDTLNSIRESFIALDRNWTFTYVNDRIASHLGKPREEIIGRPIWELFPEYEGSLFYTNYRRVLEERIPLKFEVASTTGAYVWEVHAYPTDEGLSAYVLDITERRATESALRTSEQRYRCLVEALSAIVFRANAEGAFDEPQSGWENYTGQSWREQQGQNWLDAFHSEDRPRVAAAWAETVSARTRFVAEARLWTAAASTFHHVSVTAVPIVDGNGGVREWIGTVTDVHEQRTYEELLQRSAKLESLGLLAGGIAHDFNNLLVGILGGASILQQDLATVPELKSIADTIARSSERAKELTQQMLAFSGRGHFQIRTLSISNEVQEIVALVTASIPKHVRLVLNLPGDLPPIDADAGQLQQLIMNLVINAAEAIHTAGEVHVTGYRKFVPCAATVATGELAAGEYVVLEVRDEGIGMDAETSSKIFDPFFTTKFTGRGLGLAAALGIVRGHGGGIEVESQRGHGTTFKVFLPRSRNRVVTNQTAKIETPAGSGTILVIDDEEVVVKITKTALEKRGYKVVTACNGQEGIEAFTRNFDEDPLVLLDMTMPVMEGRETFERLRSARPTVRVLGMSGYTEDEALKHFGTGLAGFIQKPFSASHLCRVVKSAQMKREKA